MIDADMSDQERRSCEMRKQWKQLMAICFAAVMVVTMPSASLLADEMPAEEEIIVTEAEEPEETMDYYESSGEDKTIDGNELLEEYDDGHISAEEVVGVGDIQVGNGVTATVDSTTGAVKFYSNGGTLWRDWIEKIGLYRGAITSVKVVSGTVYLPEDSSEIFALGEDYGRGISTKLEELDLRGFNTSRVKNMERMFVNCSKLTELDLSNFNTSKVTNLRGMFLNCKSLTRLNLRSFDTSKVTNMESMFYRCENLRSIDVDMFDTSNVTTIAGMFAECYSLSSINVSGFDTSKVVDMACLFLSCSNLLEIDTSNFDTSNVTSMYAMFDGCEKLKEIDVSKFDTSNVTDFGAMFASCKGLTKLSLNNFDTSNGTSFLRMFFYCNFTEYLDLSSFDMSNEKPYDLMYRDMFGGCYLNMLITPRICSDIDFSLTMYDETGRPYGISPNGVEYGSLSTTKSIVLTRRNPKRTYDISKCSVEITGPDYYDGNITPTVTVIDGPTRLVRDKDYIIQIENHDDPGTSSVVITGIGDCIGEQTVPFKVNKHNPYFCFVNREVTKTLNDEPFTVGVTAVDYLSLQERTITYISSDTSVATVDYHTGLVTVKGNGTAIITATYAENVSYMEASASFTLTVRSNAQHPTSIEFSDVQDLTHPYYNAIYWAAESGITKGYPDGTFGINRNCTRGEMMMFLWRYANKPAPKTVSNSPFKDVPKTHTFYKAILWGSQKGITKGYSDGTFGVNRNVTRGECMMFLWRLKGKPTPKTVAISPFYDVQKTHVFYKAILWGSQKGITKGYTSGPKKGSFGINDNCLRGQIVTFLYRAK